MSLGSVPRIELIRAVTSAAASLLFRLSTKEIVMDETLSVDVDVIESTPPTDATASSIGFVTARSTSSGLAPG